MKSNQAESEFGFGGLEHYGLNDYKRLLLRRKWTVVFTMFVIALITAAVVYFVPNSYKASTTILIDPGKVPDAYVHSTVTLSAGERLALLKEQILSDTRLSQLIEDMGLYNELKRTQSQFEILAQMRKDIDLKPVFVQGSTQLTAFTISYTSGNASTAARVANRLASFFIDENLKSREEQVMGTVDFIDKELEKARENLAEKGRKLEEIRSKHSSELPEAQSAHVQAITTLELELRSEMDSMSRAQQQKVYLESMLSTEPPIVDLDSSGTSSDAASGLDEQLARLQAQQEKLRARYGPRYPDVMKTQEAIEKLKDQIKDVRKSLPASKPLPPSVIRHRNPVIESQIAALNEEMDKHTKRQQELKSEISYHQALLEKSPAIAQQLAVLTRDYQQAEADYTSLQNRKFSADVSSDMESRQKGERFLILEPAQTPAKPDSPNRPLTDGVGLVGGLVIGIVLVLASEVLDPTVKTVNEVTEELKSPVLGEIPWITTATWKRRQRWQLLFMAAGNTLLMFAYLAVVAISLRK